MRAGAFLVDILISLYVLALMLRFLLQLARADFYNPVSQALVKITNPVVKPLRRVIPGYRGMDLAALVIIFLLEALKVVVIAGLIAGQPLNAGGVVVFSLRAMAVTVLRIYFWTILIQALLSWVNPGTYNPVSAILWGLNEPILRRVRRFLPSMEGMDFSPLLVLIVLEVVLIFLTGSVFGF